MGRMHQVSLEHSKFTIMGPYRWGDQFFPSKFSFGWHTISSDSFLYRVMLAWRFGGSSYGRCIRRSLKVSRNCIWQSQFSIERSYCWCILLKKIFRFFLKEYRLFAVCHTYSEWHCDIHDLKQWGWQRSRFEMFAYFQNNVWNVLESQL